MAERILTEDIVSITDLKTNPVNAVAGANGNPVAVLNRNKPAFYAVPTELYESIMDIIDDMELAKIAQSRKNEKSIEVSLDDL